MFGLEKWADFFDEMHKDNMRFYRQFGHQAVQRSYQENGEGFLHYKTVVSLAMGDALFDLVQIMGGAMVDNLRLGEGVKKGGFGYVEDGFRLLTFAGPVLKIGRIARTMLVPGGKMSCAFTSPMKALRLTGRSYFAPLSALAKNLRGLRTRVLTSPGNFETEVYAAVPGDLKQIKNFLENEVKNGQKVTRIVKREADLTERAIVGSEFKGSFQELTDIHYNLQQMGVKSRLLPVKTIDDVGKLLDRRRGVLVLHINWLDEAGQVSGRHFITAHRSFGLRFFADQGGTFQRGNAVKHSHRLETEVLLIEESGLLAMEDVPLMLKMSAAPLFNYIAVPLFEIDPSILSQAESYVREKTRRPVPGSPNTHVQSQPPPNFPSPPSGNGKRAALKNTAGLSQRPVTVVINGDGATQTTFVYTYRPIAGDTLYGVAKKFYGDAAAYPWVQKANPGLFNIAPHQQIAVGQEIIIP